MDVRGYVLAGGRSSRMREDKAALRLGGRTLLEIAVSKLRRFCNEVVVVGERELVPEGVRVIPDMRPGCGPMGGMEATLTDVGEGRAAFLPVDMPFLPSGLLEKLMRDWAAGSARVCVAAADGRLQPLVSLVRGDVLDEVRRALGQGEYRVAPLLHAAGGGSGGFVRSDLSTAERDRVWPGWMPSDREWALRELWFLNLNTPEQFREAERLVAGAGVGASGR